MNEMTEKREMQQDFYEQISDLVQRLAYPEKYAPDWIHWFSGDGPAEAYFSELSRKAREILEK